MSMRYLFHILMSIRDGNPSTAKDYRMPEEQFRADVESKLGRRLPESMRSVLSGFSKQVRFHWFLDESERLVLRKKMPGLIKATTKTCLNSRKGPSTAAVIWTAGCGIWIN